MKPNTPSNLSSTSRGGLPSPKRLLPKNARGFLLAVVVVLAAVGAIYWGLLRIGRRSGVTDADLSQPLPGDNLVPDPHLLADRVAIIDAPPERVWPWLVQLGKDRAGWYFPAWVERLLPVAWRGARLLDPRFQQVQVGDLIPDYGPGNGQFKAIIVDPPHMLVYYSLRQPKANWGWPAVDNPLPADALALSWVLILEPAAPDQTRLYIRLRANPPGGKPLSVPMKIAGGFIDWSTIELLYQGLNERVRSAP